MTHLEDRSLVEIMKSKIECLSRDDIARRAEGMLVATFKEPVDTMKPVPLERLIAKFVQNQWLTFSYDQDLGHLPGNRKIFGEFRVLPTQILIDRSLEAWSPRFCFSLAHEIGHFVLHRQMIGNGKYIDREQLPSDEASRLRYRGMVEMSDLGWAEWQANEFAMALIMPVVSAVLDVHRIQGELGITRNRGIIYLDHQPCNKIDFGRVLYMLCQKYQVTSGLMRRRLRHLNILHDRRPRRKQDAIESLGSLFYSEGE